MVPAPAPDPATEADRRFAERLEATGARDPREYYRGLLRELRARDEEAYRSLVARYEAEVVTPVAQGDRDPLEAWLAFGVTLAETAGGAGRTVVVDATGLAAPLDGAPTFDQLVLHLPDEKGSRALPVGLPPELTAPQRAAVDLLVNGKVRP
jgi:hypothetical protein